MGLAAEFPEWIARLLDGRAIHSKPSEAFVLSTVDESGWPHSAMLSVGELLVVDRTTLRVVLWPSSHTARNVHRDPRFTLTLAGQGSLTELRFNVRRIDDRIAHPLILFEAKLLSSRAHDARYAQVLTGITFQLYAEQQSTVLTRWEHQIQAMRH